MEVILLSRPPQLKDWKENRILSMEQTDSVLRQLDHAQENHEEFQTAQQHSNGLHPDHMQGGMSGADTDGQPNRTQG